MKKMDSISHVSDKRLKKKLKNNNKSDEIKIKPQKGKIKKKKRGYLTSKGMIYLGHIPHGFYEEQMTGYFSQFGKVLKAVVARSKKTGRSKGYGFVEFADEDVAKIAAESMNNYLMYNRIIKCRYISPEERKSPLFVRTCKPLKNKKLNTKLKNQHIEKITPEAFKKKTQKKVNDLKKFFEERGIDFTFKLNDENESEREKPKGVKETTVKSDSSRDSESEDDTDDQFGVLEIDESDTDIHFKTPPQVKKVIKRSVNSPAVPQASSPGRKKQKVGKVKNSNEIQLKVSQIKNKKKSKTVSPILLKSKSEVEIKPKVLSKGIGKKFAKDVKEKKPTLKKSFKAKKNETVKTKTLGKGKTAVVGQKKKKKIT